jgi:DNA repair protein RadC
MVAAAKAQLSHRVRRGTTLSSPRATGDLLNLELGTFDREVLALIFLDQTAPSHQLREKFRGTIDGASVQPREVVKEALKESAAAVILGTSASEWNCRAVPSRRVDHPPPHHRSQNASIARVPAYQS